MRPQSPHDHARGRELLKPLSICGISALLVLCLPETASATITTCNVPDCSEGCGEGDPGSWAMTWRPEVLVTSWNTPVDGMADPVPPPDPEGSGPIFVSLSQSSIDNEFFGILDLTIDGLSLGQTVLVQKFRLDNDQGQINENSVLVESNRITDGIAVKAGGVYNFNLLNDVTPRDGQIRSQLDFWEPDAGSITGEYLYLVSSPLDSFPAQGTRLTVTDVVTPQRFTGNVTSGGQPLAGALVALLDPLANTKDFIKGTTTDANGNYTLYAPYEDEFEIVALKEGYVGPFSVGTEAVIGEGEEITIDLALEEGTRTISGTLVDDASGEPIPGVQLFFGPADGPQLRFSQIATATTDASGAFSVRVTPGRWGALIRAQTAYKIGYIGHNTYYPLAVADASAADVSGFQVPITKARSMLWGNLFSDSLSNPEAPDEALPLCGVEVYAFDYENQKVAWGVTDGDGCYRIAVTPGRWSVVPYSLSLAGSGHSATPAKELTIARDNQSLFYSFFCRPTGGAVIGNVTDAEWNPVGGLILRAYNADLDNNELSNNSTYQSDGFYFFYLPEGTWRIYPDVFSASERGKLFLNLPVVTVENGPDDEYTVADIDVEDPSATVEVTLTDPAGNPLPGVYVHGMATIDGVTVDSFAGTDAAGVVRLPAAEGEWELHFGDGFLHRVGMQAMPAFHVSVTGPVASVHKQATPLTHGPAKITSVTVVDEDLELEGTGESGEVYSIEVSLDLEEWFSIGSVRAVDGKFKLIDRFATYFEAETYYRVVTMSSGL